MNQAKFDRLFNLVQNRFDKAKETDEVSGFLLAICYVKLGEYKAAQQLFEKSCLAMFGPPQMWKMTAMICWLVEVWILSARKDLYLTVLEELEKFKEEMPKDNANSPVAYYSYSLVEILYPTGIDISPWVQILMAKPGFKEMVASGQVFQSVLDRDEIALNSAIKELLNIHQGKAKHGILRETPEGFLCMSAMSLAYAAHRYGLKVDVDSEYFSPGYLNYMIEHTG
jgi:hypothetical protein